ncbi:uncharacterized protein VTP21DRAFT_8393 [Calcarisporiella thermophila]|uniref:uncharacterized protein n=1 Tax=Calcarisporiella thermophila TaxID=911321 RepID=UPI0037447A38
MSIADLDHQQSSSDRVEKKEKTNANDENTGSDRKNKEERKRKLNEIDSVDTNNGKLKKKKKDKEKGDKLEKKDKKKKKKEKRAKEEKKVKKEKFEVIDESKGMDISSGYSQFNHAAGDAQLRKCFYKPHIAQDPISVAEVNQYYKQHSIEVTGNEALWKPITEFKNASFDEKLMQALNKFEKPTPIQATCWPVLLNGHDIIGIAETGSGKTFAFALPAITHIMGQSSFTKKPKEGPIVLVVAPTRELAIQTYEQFEAAGSNCGIKSTCIYGGVSKYDQKKALQGGVHVLVCTPGRLLDLVNESIVNLSSVSFLVLDEADRMLDVGFEEPIRQIISMARKDRQTVMFSATWPENVQKLAQDFLSSPVKVTIGSPDLAASQNVKQTVEVLNDPRDKERRLIQLLNQYHKSRKNRVLVFVLYKKEAVRIENMIMRQGFKVQSIHGDKNQYQRTEALNAFKDGSYPLLIATDVAARGLDIPDVEYVLNYTFPLTIEDYVHRIGRTGRGGKKGFSHTLFTQNDKAHSGELINVLRQANQEVPDSLLKFGTTVKKKEHKSYGAFFREIDPAAKPTKIVFDTDE